jgi:hypothetical protein
MQIICYDIENQIIACLGKFHSRAGIIGAQKASISIWSI